ncbi:MAG: ABC transporter substrate-binding protein [Lautropia sp.]
MKRRIAAFRTAAFRKAAILCAAAAFGGTLAGAAGAQTVRIAILSDMSSVYADFQGPGSVLAAQMAVEDHAQAGGRLKVEVLSADHLNKPDVGASIARQWFDTQGVDAVFDLPNSAVALAVSNIVRDKNKVLVASGAGTAALTGAQCSPNTVQWTYDTYAYGHALGRAVHEQGGKSWFFVTADYAFGHDLEKQAADEVVARGGRVVGAIRHPIGAADMHAGVYASARHYLKAVERVGSAADGRAVVAAMKALPTDDPLFGPGTIRADGRKLHPMYLLQVKQPGESKAPWDYMNVLATIVPEDAFRPLNAGGCPLVK